MPRRIGVAFQGGGARVIGLIATAEALSELVADGDLAIEAVSGTSAGSLAALLLAGKADFRKVRAAIVKREAQIKARFPKPGKLSGFYKGARFMMSGRPVYSAQDFNALLEGILLDVGIDINKQLEDVSGVPLHIVVSDVFTGRSMPITTGPLRDVLRRSCAIPLVFASHKGDDQGQFVDGGMFDNLPTEVLTGSLPSDVAVFAIGFEPERVRATTSSFQYIISLIGSVVTNNVSRSRDSVGSDYVCPLSTSLGTLDFDKMVSVGVNEEYDAIKAASRGFFKKWAAGSGAAAPQSAGKRAASKLRDVERKLMEHVETAFRIVPGSHEFVNLSVVANSLEHPSLPDEVTVEQLLVVPKGYTLPGTIIPLLGGDGYTQHIDCIVKADGPAGPDIPFTRFLVDDEMDLSGVRVRRDSAVILFADNVSSAAERKLYVAKTETRFGFMAPLAASGHDRLAVAASFWQAQSVGIRLSVPPSCAKLVCDWAAKGSSHPVRESPPRSNQPKHGWLTVEARLQDSQRGAQLKGLFTLPGVR